MPTMPRLEAPTIISSQNGRRVQVRRARLPVGPSEPEKATAKAFNVHDRLQELSGRVRRLTVSRRDPERFHTERSDIAAEIQKVAEFFGRRPA